MRKILRVIDSVNERVGSVSSWLVAILIIVILYEVIARYVFNSPANWAFGTFRLLGGAIIVLGWAYAQLHNSHVRVDIFYTRLSPRKRALIDVIGTGILFFPLFGAFIKLAGSWWWQPFLTDKLMALSFWYSPSTLYKIIVLIGLCLFFLQFVAQFARDVYTLSRGRPL